METLSIIPVDNAVVVDGVGLLVDGVSAVGPQPNVHAIQWDEVAGVGHVEFRDGRPHEVINDRDGFGIPVILALYDEKVVEIEEEEAAAEAARIALEQTYEWLREQAYPKIGDQLDMLWHSMDEGEIPKSADFYTQLEAVKNAYPKTGE